MIDYDHAINLHTTRAPECIVPLLLKEYNIHSVLDIGCGTGVWLNQFNLDGVQEIYGIDGIGIESREYHADRSRFRCLDLSQKVDLGRTFDLAVCLEVAEHLPASSASVLVESLCKHADLVLFSAAIPHQGGTGHINCQWPEYWQELFNANGFSCEDWLRPLLWNEAFPEFWYKQNIFTATLNPKVAGREKRLLSLVHPSHYESWFHMYNGYHTLVNGEMGLNVSLHYAISMIARSAIDAFHRRVFSRSRLSK